MSADRRSRGNVFASLALDRCSERRQDRDWIDAVLAAPEARYLLIDGKGKALVTATSDALQLFDGGQFRQWFADSTPWFLGRDADTPYFLLTPDAASLAVLDETTFMDLRRAGSQLSGFQAGLFAYARALAYWQSRTRFCGACGSPLVLEWGGHRARCPACALEHYPRTDPAIIVIVTCGDRCLLGRQSSWAPGRYSTLAGFVEPGETLEDAVRREVMEEAGVSVVDCDYFSSQPWPFPASLMLGFTARADDPRIAVGDELADARWFSVADIISGLRSGELSLSPPLSVSFSLIEHWLRETAGLELHDLVATPRLP